MGVDENPKEINYLKYIKVKFDMHGFLKWYAFLHL